MFVSSVHIRQGGLRRCRCDGFSLTEVLVVIGVMAALLGLILGGTGSMNGTQGMTAVHQVAALYDLARAKALRGESGVVIAFANMNVGVAGKAYRSAIVCADDPSTEAPDDVRPVSEWYHLPEGFVFTLAPTASAGAGVNLLSLPNGTRPVRFPGAAANVELPCVGFGSLGEVVFPESDAEESLLIAIAEGWADSGNPRARSGQVHLPGECRWIALRRNSGSPMILP